MIARLRERWRWIWCVLVNGGHYKQLHLKPEHICLRCIYCGHSSPGWIVTRRLT